MPVTLYECPMGHEIRFNSGACSECEGELMPVQYMPVPKEFMASLEEQIHVSEDRTVFFLDQYWDGKKRKPGIRWEVLPSGWWAFVWPDREFLWRTGSTEFPKPEQIQSARNAYLKLYPKG